MDEMMNETMDTRVQQHLLSFYDENPFVQYLHMAVSAIAAGQVELRLQIAQEFTNVYKVAHGGVLMSAADTAMGAACLSLGKKVVTLDFGMNFLQAVPAGAEMTARGRVIHNGSRTMVCECDLLAADGQLFGRAHGTFFVIGRFGDAGSEQG
jgi:acyl-CoA thioesterase